MSEPLIEILKGFLHASSTTLGVGRNDGRKGVTWRFFYLLFIKKSPPLPTEFRHFDPALAGSKSLKIIIRRGGSQFRHLIFLYTKFVHE
jgi:hypothetical protein